MWFCIGVLFVPFVSTDQLFLSFNTEGRHEHPTSIYFQSDPFRRQVVAMEAVVLQTGKENIGI